MSTEQIDPAALGTSSHRSTRVELGYCLDCVVGEGHNTWPVTCATCSSWMVATRAGFQCPRCDHHEVCTLVICGHDEGTATCGLRGDR